MLVVAVVLWAFRAPAIAVGAASALAVVACLVRRDRQRVK